MPLGGVSKKYVECVSKLPRLGFRESEADVAEFVVTLVARLVMFRR